LSEASILVRCGVCKNAADIIVLTLGTAAYVSSKHLVMGLTKAAALDLAPHRVHVNAINPGCMSKHVHASPTRSLTNAKVISSNMTNNVLGDPTMNQIIRSMQPFKGIGEPEDIARVAVFLASEDASFISGIALPADGGYTMQ